MTAAPAPPPAPWTRGERLALALCAAAAFAVRLVRWERAAVLFNDGPVFLALAERTAAGAPETLLQHPFHPLYPLAIALAHALGRPFGLSLETAGALVGAIAGVAAVLALHAFVRSAFGRGEALAAAWLLTLHAGAVEVGGDVQSEGLYVALFLASCAALWPALQAGRRGAALAGGAFSGLAYLTRPEGLGVALVGIALAGLHALRGRLAPGRAAALAGLIGAGAAAFVAPYGAALSAQSGELLLTRKKTVSWVVGAAERRGSGGLATGQAGMEAPKVRERPPRAQAGGVAAQSEPAAAGAGVDPYDSLVAPPWTARAALPALADVLDDTAGALRPEMLALVLVGALALRGRPGPRAGFVGAVVGAYAVLLCALAMNVGYVSERHALPPLLLLLGYAAVGALAAGRALGRFGSEAAAPRRSRIATAAILAAVAAIGLGKSVRKPEGLEALAERRAAEWVRAQDEVGSVVAARKRRVAYYAGAPFVQLRPKSPAGFVRYFDDHAVRFVVVNAADVAEYVGLTPLVGARLVPLHRVEAEGEAALVYRWLPAPAGAEGS